MSDEEFANGRPRRRGYSPGRQQTSRQSDRNRSSASAGQVRRRQPEQDHYSQRKVQTPAADRAAREMGSSRRPSTRRSSSYRSTQTDERLSQYTRRDPYAEHNQSTSRRAEWDDRREPRQARQRNASPRQNDRQLKSQPRRETYDSEPSILGRILGVLAAIGTAIVNFFGWVGQIIPPLRRFSAGAVTAMAAVLLVAVFGVSFAIGQSGTSEPEILSVTAESEGSAESAEAESAVVTNAANPNEPADLVWRDTDFAVDPSYNSWSNKDNGHKTVFLTFDDGPSQLTEQFLDLLDKYNVKATFFVTGQSPQYYNLIQEAYNRGHTIGLHTMSHDYEKIYSSEDAFFKDLDEIGQLVKDQIGYVPCFIRFPGGSSNTMAESTSPGLMPKLVGAVQARGYQYYDWSLASGDGEIHSADEIIALSTQSTGEEFDPSTDMNIMLLCHDSGAKQSTLDALPAIIEHYQAAGYTFEAMDRKTWICHHPVYIPDTGTTDEENTEETDDENAEETYDESDGETAEEEYV